jgi:phosphocarrier protein
MGNTHMSERTVTVASAVGLHARPAALFSQAAAGTGVSVTLKNKVGKSVNAASILGVLSLGVAHGDEVVLSAEGDGADVALDSLAALLSTDLDTD